MYFTVYSIINKNSTKCTNIPCTTNTNSTTTNTNSVTMWYEHRFYSCPWCFRLTAVQRMLWPVSTDRRPANVVASVDWPPSSECCGQCRLTAVQRMLWPVSTDRAPANVVASVNWPRSSQCCGQCLWESREWSPAHQHGHVMRSLVWRSVYCLRRRFWYERSLMVPVVDGVCTLYDPATYSAIHVNL